MSRADDSLLAAWCAAHNVGPKWLAGAGGSWVALWLFASITIPLKYPYEARGQVVDSGVVVGLLIPLAVMNVVLDEGPRDLVRASARRLSPYRLTLAIGYFLTVALMSATMATASALPTSLVVTDSILLASLSILGTGLLGVRLGWAPSAAVAFTMSAPGLIPWHLNAVYHRDVGPEFVVIVVTLAVTAIAVFAQTGATELPRVHAWAEG